MTSFRFSLVSTTVRAAAMAALAATGLAAQAQSASPLQGLTLHVGGVYIDVHAKADALSGTQVTYADGSVHSAKIAVGDAATVGFGLVYRFNPTWSAELVLGLPPEHSVYGKDKIEAFDQISLVKQAPPTAFVNYHFAEVADGVSFFTGLGLNYTRFLKVRNTPSGNAAGGGPTKTKLDPSWGLAAHVGGTWKIDEHWAFVGTVAYVDVRSTMTSVTQTNLGAGPTTVTRTADINFRPLVYSLSLGYSF